MPYNPLYIQEDRSTNELQARIAQMTGKEAALFCVSGTMVTISTPAYHPSIFYLFVANAASRTDEPARDQDTSDSAATFGPLRRAQPCISLRGRRDCVSFPGDYNACRSIKWTPFDTRGHPTCPHSGRRHSHVAYKGNYSLSRPFNLSSSPPEITD
jgi:hypothetical protein